MAKTAYIFLRSGKEIVVNNLKFIYCKIDDETVSISDTPIDFYLYSNIIITFQGEDNVITLNTSDIEYLYFSGFPKNN